MSVRGRVYLVTLDEVEEEDIIGKAIQLSGWDISVANEVLVNWC